MTGDLTCEWAVGEVVDEVRRYVSGLSRHPAAILLTYVLQLGLCALRRCDLLPKAGKLTAMPLLFPGANRSRIKPGDKTAPDKFPEDPSKLASTPLHHVYSARSCTRHSAIIDNQPTCCCSKRPRPDQENYLYHLPGPFHTLFSTLISDHLIPPQPYWVRVNKTDRRRRLFTSFTYYLSATYVSDILATFVSFQVSSSLDRLTALTS